MANSNEHRELPHCPECTDDLILIFDEVRIEKDRKAVILDVPKMKCPSCGFIGVKPSLSQATLEVGAALDLYTRRPLLRHSLKLMRGPAKAAGLGELQRFLESGFDTFKEMQGANAFLRTIAIRERALADAIFDPRTSAADDESTTSVRTADHAVRLLPPDAGKPLRGPSQQ